MSGKQALAQTVLHSLSPVVHFQVGGDEPKSDDLRLLQDLLEATPLLHAYVEFFDPLSGVYRIVLVGSLCR